jgi:GAF domain
VLHCSQEFLPESNLFMLNQTSASAMVSAQLADHLAFILKATLRITGDMGTLQLFDPLSCSLRIVSQCGFDEDFLKFFNSVRQGEAACGTSLLRRRRVVVENVAKDPLFAGTAARGVLLAAGVCALQSTPLFSRFGQPLGVLSTHYRKTTRPAVEDLRAVDRLADHAVSLLERVLGLAPYYAERFHLENGPSNPYSIFCRIADTVSFVESTDSRQKALRRLRALSLAQRSEFVLFHQMHIIAASERGIVRLRHS